MDNPQVETEQPIKKKRGRKPKNSQDKIYFGEREEQAVRDYILSDSMVERNKIFIDILEPAFCKLIEALIRRYKLYVPGETFEETFYDALSELARIIDKFNINSGKRAYSYYGNCIKHYITHRREKAMSKWQSVESYDCEDESISNSIYFSEKYDKDKHIAQDEIALLSCKLKDMVNNPENYRLKPNEQKLCYGLVNLLDNWDLVISSDGSNKLNKSAVLLFLREQTGFDSKTIRTNLKRFKREYLLVKHLTLSQY